MLLLAVRSPWVSRLRLGSGGTRIRPWAVAALRGRWEAFGLNPECAGTEWSARAAPPGVARGFALWAPRREQIAFSSGGCVRYIHAHAHVEQSEDGRLIYTGNMARTVFDDKKPIPKVDVTTCLSWKHTKGYLSIYYVPRRDMKDLYFNIHVEFKSSILMPLRKEVLCRGIDSDYSFCSVLKGETINTTVPFSFSLLKFPKGFYIFIAEAFTGSMEDSLFCCNITLTLK
ncbi:transmembrane protein 70, mitochondrial isoform X2 [Dromiciops gliroides]|uniref:transmembrane protein 70, mitochondrial isoform X2 n=1 Tax=Dromiciops gliroides TaxID=33562 RepID=UPI001CC3CFF8|nr:transmembrane protein 70, mitochondrial isoform X2 [Dromiciops gliroides]